MNECEKSRKVRRGRRAGTIRSRAAVALAVLCLFGAACSEDPSSGAPEREPAGGEAVVRLTIAPPRPSLPQMRAAEDLDEAESRVGTVRVLVFEQEGGRYLYRNMAEGEQVRFSGSATRFEVRLPGTPNPVKLALVCNYGDAFERYAPAAGSDEATVRERIGRSFSGLTGDLPMYGEISLPSGLRADAENRFDVRLLRAVARVDVTKALDAGSRPFRIGEVYVYRPNDKIRIVPDDMGSAESPRVTAPSVFAGAQKSAEPVKVTAAEPDPASVAGICLPESAAESDPAAQLSEATCIVVGGYYDGQERLSYYRIDFDPGIDGHPFGQVLRNYKYVFRIRKVLGEGWSDPDTAATSRATGIAVETEAWEDFTTEMYFEGDNYLGVSARSVSLGYVAGKTARVDVQASVPYSVRWLDASGVPTGGEASQTGEVLENGSFSVAIGRDAGAGETLSYLSFSALADNRTDRDVTARLRVTGGRWTFDIAVTQGNPSQFRTRIVRVLSVQEIGDLGTNTPTSASGLPMRRILDNAKNFSPGGTVVIGGFSFSEASRAEMQATGTGSAADKEIFRSMQATIGAQDVIYLTYNTPISNELAQVVLAWLRAAPGRVLIVGTDTDTSNAQLRQYLTSDGTWKYYYRNNLGGQFRRAARTDANARFFTMPFGTVAENAPVVRADDYAAYCSDYPSRVTPLVVSDVSGQGGTLIVGVNGTDRIVYLGDASLHQYNRLSSQANADGTVTTDFDRLMANLWAWIVERVCGAG